MARQSWPRRQEGEVAGADFILRGGEWELMKEPQEPLRFLRVPPWFKCAEELQGGKGGGRQTGHSFWAAPQRADSPAMRCVAFGVLWAEKMQALMPSLSPGKQTDKNPKQGLSPADFTM